MTGVLGLKWVVSPDGGAIYSPIYGGGGYFGKIWYSKTGGGICFAVVNKNGERFGEVGKDADFLSEAVETCERWLRDAVFETEGLRFRTRLNWVWYTPTQEWAAYDGDEIRCSVYQSSGGWFFDITNSQAVKLVESHVYKSMDGAIRACERESARQRGYLELQREQALNVAMQAIAEHDTVQRTERLEILQAWNGVVSGVYAARDALIERMTAYLNQYGEDSRVQGKLQFLTDWKAGEERVNREA